MSAKQNAGNQGEKLAADYLRQRGYAIVTTNWRCSFGELDIVAQHQDVTVFVEVRARKRIDDAFASITPVKRERLLRAIDMYIQTHLTDDARWRVDVIAVSLAKMNAPTIVHARDALDW